MTIAKRASAFKWRKPASWPFPASARTEPPSDQAAQAPAAPVLAACAVFEALAATLAGKPPKPPRIAGLICRTYEQIG